MRHLVTGQLQARLLPSRRRRQLGCLDNQRRRHPRTPNPPLAWRRQPERLAAERPDRLCTLAERPSPARRLVFDPPRRHPAASAALAAWRRRPTRLAPGSLTPGPPQTERTSIANHVHAQWESGALILLVKVWVRATMTGAAGGG